MDDNLPMDVLVTLPLYTDGVAAGRAIGLRDALDCLTGERLRLDAAPSTRCVPYADAALGRVQTAIANLFIHAGAS